MVGWDEVLHPDCPKASRAVVARAAIPGGCGSQGYRGLLSHGYYLDLIWAAAQHYAADPLAGAAANLTPEQQKLILAAKRACGRSMFRGYSGFAHLAARCGRRGTTVVGRNPRRSDSMYARLEEVSRGLIGLA